MIDISGIKVHRGGDGLPPRRVFVNGNLIKNAVLADIERGIVEFHPEPPRLCKSQTGQIYTRKLRGTVTVELANANGQ